VLTDGQKFAAATGMPAQLSDREGETRFIIDYAGVPPEWHDHISTGYPSFYQQPLERYFAALARQ
jgi:hypothetical protein